jgi:hypothetical protein
MTYVSPQPRGNGLHERREAPGCDGEVSLEDAIELEERLVIEGDAVERVHGDARLAQTSPDGVVREAGVVLHPAEALLLRGGHDLSIAQQARRGVVVVRRDSEVVGKGGTVPPGTRDHAAALRQRCRAPTDRRGSRDFRLSSDVLSASSALFREGFR